MNVQEAIACVQAERDRQMRVEGFVEERDDQYTQRQLFWAASAYFTSGCRLPIGMRVTGMNNVPNVWPSDWRADWWKPKTPRRDFERAGALCLAERDRIDRAGRRGVQANIAHVREAFHLYEKTINAMIGNL